jgi:hypothetical protein
MLRRNKSFDPYTALVAAAKSMYSKRGWPEHDFLSWIQAFPVIFPSDVDTIDDRRMSQIESLCDEILEVMRSFNRRQMRSSREFFTTWIDTSMNEIFQSGTIDLNSHPFKRCLSSSTAHAAIHALKYFGVTEARESLRYGLRVFESLLRFAELASEIDPSKSAATHGTNDVLVNRYRDVVETYLLQGEQILNAGASYIPAHGATGDGTLVVTDRRLLFVFDEDFRKPPLIILRQGIRSTEFNPTNVVPISKEMTVFYYESNQAKMVSMFVGKFFAAEIQQLLKY